MFQRELVCRAVSSTFALVMGAGLLNLSFALAEETEARQRLQEGGCNAQTKSPCRSSSVMSPRAGAVSVVFGRATDSFQVSQDGTRLQFPLDVFGEQVADFAFNLALLTVEARPPNFARSASIAAGCHSVIPDDMGSFLTTSAQGPEVNGRRGVDSHENSKPLWTVDAHGGRRVIAPVVCFAKATGDGRLVIAAYDDGTVRWHRTTDGRELLALFVNKENWRWAAWTPSGYYMTSPGGEDTIAWQVNRVGSRNADFFPASRLRERFSRPDIVQQVLIALDEGKAIEAANRAAKLSSDTTPVNSRLPPVISILSPSDGGSVRDREIAVDYELRSPSGLPVDTVEVLIDGRPSRGIKPLHSGVTGARIERQMVSLPNRDVELGLLARSGSLVSEVAKVKLRWQGSTALQADEGLKPKLYGVIVGVSSYNDKALQLKYAAKDAKDFAAALQLQKGGLYRDVELKVLADAEATLDAIRRSLTWLERSVTSRDVGIVFLAGHGLSDAKNQYYYLAVDSDRKQLEDTALDGVTLRQRTRRLASKVLVFLDTCYAGQALGPAARGATDINSLVNDLSSTENGVVTYASSTGREVSQEDASWGNGAFTKALIEGLGASGVEARADIRGKGVITTAALDLWVSERVKELTGGSQHPVMVRPVPDFPMFFVRN
ncbi:caspase family protein [Bradyrhizobium sp. 21]|uniref:caspase family protein n=1 Tax=Bradyrhizobium sp. 21 TaxID=2782666 RepID=UPI001FF8AB2C|nr:caspase family protein [Bradyrhizobium sp. 21]MCK1389032.1 caspase family protein [Bradyrhizobium sp. 21]